MAGQMRRVVVFLATVEAGVVQQLQLGLGCPALGRTPGRCLPTRVEAMMQWLEPTGQPATAAPSTGAAIPRAFKPLV